ncbi:hypothetical protein FAM09_17040 [Niastella caeni]|uniref:YD repeat-containing protein n=1 Tax=Niastella caeni TaxID=2569763 RepID=A0A4S8HUQ3_9BACT|nr:hypothetical protein [Niastella caeni]THU38379.1 hypothetical protein FAM09_17040 [Niastella caeni]
MRNCLITVLLAIAWSNTVFSQADIAAPQIIPPSPDAAALGKYGEFPTDLSNGLTKIEIPLYTIKSRSLELPISLSYHAGGNKIDDIASWVGLGWVLNATGVVTRTVRGRADELGGYLNFFMTTRQVDLSTSPDSVYSYLDPRSKGIIDSESDMYTYNANGISGTFMYTKDQQLLQVPLTDNKIIDNPGNNYTIISDNGTTYIFDVAESSWHNDQHPVNTAFYLSKMISADKTDTIYFEYFTDGRQYGDVSLSEFTNCDDEGGITLDVNANRSTRILQKITFAGGYVSFICKGDRIDKRKYRLSDIKVYDNNQGLKNWIQLAHGNYTSFTPASIDTVNYENHAYRLRLDSVKMLDQTGKLAAAWSLHYNNTVLPAYYAATNPNATYYFGQDLWGYYNGVFTNSRLLHYTAPCISAPANRSVSTTHAQAGILQEIRFPTGGRTVFTYESNACGSPMGGLRIKQIDNYVDSIAPPVTKSYAYGGCYTTGYSGYQYSPNNYVYTKAKVYVTAVYELVVRNFYVSSPTLPLSYNSNTVFYKNVIEYNGTSEKNTGKTEYDFEAEEDSVYATNVKLPTPDNTYNYPVTFTYPRYGYYSASRSWSRGPLKESRVYRREPNGDFTLIKKTVNTYQFYKPQTVITGINVFKNFSYPLLEHSASSAAEARFRFQYFDVITNTWSKKLRQTTVTDYANGLTLNQITKFDYDAVNAATNPHLLLTRQVIVNSRGDSIAKQLQYPRDFTGTAVYDSMLQNNIKSTVVREVEKFNGTDNKGTYTQFNQYTGQGGAMYLPAMVQKYYKNSGWKNEIIFDQYDETARLRQMHHNNHIPVAYLWDYQKKYPVAEVTAAAVNDIAYTSFEGDGQGNFSFTGTTTVDNTAPTGNRCYALTGSNNIVKQGLTASKTYIVSYWQKNNATTPLTITGTQGTAVKGKTVSGWTYFEHTVTGVSLVTITATAKSIDELRVYPIEAQMTTYTYVPLIGMTSRCDANNYIVYYEYDGYNRLKLVRDQDKNIIKTIDYNYTSGTGQPGTPVF